MPFGLLLGSCGRSRCEHGSCERQRADCDSPWDRGRPTRYDPDTGGTPAVPGHRGSTRWRSQPQIIARPLSTRLRVLVSAASSALLAVGLLLATGCANYRLGTG